MTAQDEQTLCEGADIALAEGDLHKAAELCKSLLGSFPDSARGYHLTSSLFQATGNYNKARDYSAMAIRMDAQAMQYHMQQGRILFLLKDYEAAITAFKRAGELSDSDGESSRWLGKCYAVLERFDDAKAFFARARAKMPESDIAIDEAECEMQSGDAEAAERTLSGYIAHNPESAPAYYKLALLAIYSGEFPRAEAILRKTLFLDPRHAPAHFYLALLLADSGQDRDAANRLLQALEIDPTHAASLLMLGGIFMNSGDSVAAEKAFSHVLALIPDHVLAWYSLLEVLNARNEGREGIQRLIDATRATSKPLPLKHLRALFAGDVPPFATPEFITAFYSAFIDMFEPWIVAGASAEHVDQFVSELRSMPEFQNKRHLSLLDLGCNTGVIAAKMTDMTAIRVGVDLSPQMVKIARRSKQYDVLYEIDIVDFVLGSETTFDLITATGALRWIGNLQPFMQAVRGVMHKESLLVFMLEKEHSTLAYSVANHGRYSHHLSYVCDIAEAEGLQLVQHKELQAPPVAGERLVRHLFVFKKMTIH